MIHLQIMNKCNQYLHLPKETQLSDVMTIRIPLLRVVLVIISAIMVRLWTSVKIWMKMGIHYMKQTSSLLNQKKVWVLNKSQWNNQQFSLSQSLERVFLSNKLKENALHARMYIPSLRKLCKKSFMISEMTSKTSWLRTRQSPLR